jgi:uncharacterized protein (UPF0548 family)
MHTIRALERQRASSCWKRDAGCWMLERTVQSELNDPTPASSISLQHPASREMFLLHRPDASTIARFVAGQRDLPFTYSAVGASESEEAPVGYNVDHNRIQLGHGEETFKRAVMALRNWTHFELGWMKIVPSGVEIRTGEVVAAQAHTFGIWSLHASRIVYVLEEEVPVKRFGFAYGTLPDHAESGEERFTVELHVDGSVFYDLYAFSRPHQTIAQLSFPLVRRLQKQFAKDSLQAMANASR